MKKIWVVAGMLAFPTVANAADNSKLSLGIGYGFSNDGVISLHGDFDISKAANNAPVKARIGYDHYARNYGWGPANNYSWSYNVFYGGAYYDFNKELKLDRKLHPFIGLGLGLGSASCSGNWCNSVSNPTVGGLYFIGGVQYNLTPKIDAEVNLNAWGGLTLGVNFNL